MRNIVKACIYVDWHNAESNVRPSFAIQSTRYFQDVIFRIQEEVSKALKVRDSTVKYRATLRFYHGWHIGDQPTSIRSKFDFLKEQESFARTIGNVSFTPEIRFGNELACESIRSPLFSTSRAQGQKMVDTAIACDLLYMLRTGMCDVAIVVSDDDDFIPVAFTAEAWGLESILLRSFGRTLEHVSKIAPARLVYYWEPS